MQYQVWQASILAITGHDSCSCFLLTWSFFFLNFNVYIVSVNQFAGMQIASHSDYIQVQDISLFVTLCSNNSSITIELDFHSSNL
jgi:hypothetical protein